jgi:dynein heavy chain 1
MCAMLIIKCLRTDHLLQATAMFVWVVFEMDLSAESLFELGEMVTDDISAAMLLALISIPGYDTSY